MAARVLAHGRWPYVSTLLFALRLVPVESDDLPTVAVDRGWRLYYSPDFVMSCQAHQLATVLLHECQHLMLDHAGRFDALRQPADRHLVWNLAGDAVINAALDDAGMPWPDVRGIRYVDLKPYGVRDGMTTEAAYFAMLRARAGRRQDGGRQPAGQQGAGGSNGGDAGTELGPGRQGRGGEPPGASSRPGRGGEPGGASGTAATGRDEAEPTRGKVGGREATCGSGAGGPRGSYELAADDDAAPAAGRAQQELVRDRVGQEILAHQKSRGGVPGSLVRWAEELLHPTVEWRSVLAGLVRTALASHAGRRDFSYSFPSRRTSGVREALGGAVLPAMRQPPPPTVAAVIDTSGSIGRDELRQFLGELLTIVRSVGVGGGVRAIPCDATAHPPVQLRRAQDVAGVRLPGGGGTDMRAGITAAADLRPRADVIVVFTDGHTPWPARPPRPGPHYIAAVSKIGAGPTPSTPEWLERLDVAVR